MLALKQSGQTRATQRLNGAWQRRGRLLSCLGLIAVAWSLGAAPARADTTIAGDLDLNVPLSVEKISTGGGFGIRIGQEFHVPLLAINPEVGFTYASFSDQGTPVVYRGIVGARLGVGELFRFGVMAHVGFGHLSWTKPEGVPASIDLSHFGFTYDAGIFLEFTALPLLNIGVHAAYNRLSKKNDASVDPFQWMQLGVHLTLVL
jgi:hypothetical protein